MFEISKINVLVINTVNYELNGITNVIRNFFRNADSNINYHIVVKNKLEQGLLDELVDYNITVHTLPNRISSPLDYISELRKIMASSRFNIVHAHGNSGTLFIEMFLAKMYGIPTRIAHSHNSTCNYKVLHYLLNPFMKRCSTLKLACSEKAGKWLFKKNFTVLNNGIELDKYIFAEKVRKKYREELNITDGKKVYGHIGHFSYQKNHEFLIEIFNEIYSRDKKSVLLLLGDGDLRKQIEEKVNSLGISNAVIFLGRTPNAPQLLQTMDVLIFPSRFEGLPLSLLEAQAAGLPCIVSDKVTSESKLTNLVQFLSLNESSSIWADKILSINETNRIYESNKARQEISRAGYSIKENVEILEKFYFQGKY